MGLAKVQLGNLRSLLTQLCVVISASISKCHSGAWKLTSWDLRKRFFSYGKREGKKTESLKGKGKKEKIIEREEKWVYLEGNELFFFIFLNK